MAAATAGPPLEGVRVLDLSRMLPGGALTRLLVDLGATVVKVERPGVGDESRADGPPREGTTSTHAFLDRGKRSLALDLKDPVQRDVVVRLAADSDAVVESFRPGVADRLGVGYDDLRRVNPALVYCSVSGFGSGGPREQAAGHDLGYCARAGVLHQGGTAAAGPAPIGSQLADITGGALGAVGLLAALLRAQRTGAGDHVEVALADAALWAVGIHADSAFAGGPEGPESGGLNGAAPCYRVYRCADGRHLSVAALEYRFWSAFVAAVGDPEWDGRRFDRDLIPVVAARLAEQSLAEWVRRLDGVDACAEPVQRFAEVADDEQFRARGLVVTGADGRPRVGRPFRTASPAPAVAPAAAEVGGHGREVLREAGFSAEQIDRLDRGAAV